MKKVLALFAVLLLASAAVPKESNIDLQGESLRIPVNEVKEMKEAHHRLANSLDTLRINLEKLPK